MQVRLLGPLDVIVDDAARPVPGQRRRAVLAVLGLSAGEVVPTDRLVEVAWGDQPPAAVANALQSHISYLRRVLGGRSTIVAQPPGYALAKGPAVTDLQVALGLIEEARRSDDPAHSVAMLGAALDLWRGSPLADVPAGPWLDSQVERLRTIRLDAVQARNDARLALGEQGPLVAELEGLARQYPFHEGFHGQLMLALYRSGRQADALGAYQRLRRRLGAELGIDPGSAVRELEAAILRQDEAIGPPTATLGPPRAQRMAPAAVTAVPRHLPAEAAGFCGRARQLDELDAAAADAAATGSMPICAISGAAGLGKTTLAVHWARRIAHRYPDGQLYVNLRGFDPGGRPLGPEEVLRGFLDAFDVAPQRIPAGLNAQAALFRGLLADRRVLVVLDNARDADQVRPLLPGDPGCLVVVTSRDQLAGLVAVDGAHPLVLDLPTRDEAWQLIERRLGGARVAAEPDAAASIIEGCARLPLALAVVAARAATNPRLPLRTFASELSDARGALDALAGGEAAADVRTVFSWSYERLSGAAARLFRVLGLHPGPEISVGAGAGLAGSPVAQVRPVLAELIRTHLIIEHRPGRYTLHDLLWEYAAELVRVHDDESVRRAATDRLLDHYVHTAHAAARLVNPLRPLPALDAPRPGTTPDHIADHAGALEWFAIELPTLMAVLRRAVDTRRDSHAWQLGWILGDLLDRRGHWRELAATGHLALAAARRQADPSAQALAHRLLVTGFGQLGLPADALVHGRAALELCQRSGDHLGEAYAHRALTRVFELLERYREALDHAQRALELFRAAGIRSGQATALNSVGWFHALLGDHRGALSACEQALALQQELDDRNGQAASWDSLGYARHHLGEHAEAAACYRRSIDIYRDLGSRYDEADTTVHLAETHWTTGEADAARHAWRRALAILDDLGHPDAGRVRVRLAAHDTARATAPEGPTDRGALAVAGR